MKIQKAILKVILLVSLVCLVSCASPYVGKQFPDAKLPRLTNGGNVRCKIADMFIDYDTSIDKDKNVLSVEGLLRFASKEFTGSWDLEQVELYFFFFDEEKTIVKKQTLYIDVNTSTADAELPFKGSFKYSPEYSFVSNGYHALVSL